MLPLDFGFLTRTRLAMRLGHSGFVTGAVAALTILGGPVAAQQGTLAGTVSDVLTLAPVPSG